MDLPVFGAEIVSDGIAVARTVLLHIGKGHVDSGWLKGQPGAF
jgi:hypothetical protein